MKKINLLHCFLAFILIFLLAACQANSNKTVNEADKPTEKTKSYTVTDDTGKEVTFEKTPETVVSLQPSNTEILFAIGQGDKIIGATDYDNYPKEAGKIERVSDSVNVNAEKIIELNPDVVIAYTIGEKDALKPLEDSGIPVFVIQSASSFEDVYGDIEQIAEVMGVKEQGEKVINEIQSKIKEVEEKVATIEKPKPFYLEVSPAPEIYTTGKNTFQDEILQKAGVTNIFGDQEGWVKVSDEELVKRSPELMATTVNYTDGDPVAEIKSRKGWEKIDAIQNDEVYELDGDIMTRPGPRIGEAVELVAKTAYPELFE